MSGEHSPQYACPHCNSVEFCTQPDAYSIYRAEGDSLFRERTELVEDAPRLHCRECGQEAPEGFARVAAG